MQQLTLTTPDDWHCHLRDGDVLARTVADCAKQFHRAIVMPNLVPPITTAEVAKQYRQRIMAHVPKGLEFNPLMTLYLTEQMQADTLRTAKADGAITACKLYPAGATTHSDAGVLDVKNIFPLLEVMQDIDLPLLIHGEVVDDNVDIFDRESRFIDNTLAPLCQHFPDLRIVLEHISTRDAVDFVSAAPTNVAATITAHHLLFNRNIILAGGIRPHYYCLPILKTQDDQQALLEAATSGNPKFFLGTDSAPHAQHRKQSPCGCAGIYTAHAAIELYAQAFEQFGALDKLEHFASHFGPQFYKLPINPSTITLVKQPWQVPAQLDFANDSLIPLMADQQLQWQLHA